MTGHAPQTLQIDLGARSYPIVIGAGLLDDTDLVTSHVTARDVLVVTTETVGPLYTARLLAGLAKAEPVGKAFCGDGDFI